MRQLFCVMAGFLSHHCRTGTGSSTVHQQSPVRDQVTDPALPQGSNNLRRFYKRVCAKRFPDRLKLYRLWPRGHSPVSQVLCSWSSISSLQEMTSKDNREPLVCPAVAGRGGVPTTYRGRADTRLMLGILLPLL